MKKILYLASLLTILGLCSISCKKAEQPVPETKPEPLFTELTVQMPVTKTTYAQGAEAMTCEWEAGDKMTLYAVNNIGNGIGGSIAHFTSQNAGNKAVFSGEYTFESMDPENTKYYCIYPAMDTYYSPFYYSDYNILESTVAGTNCIDCHISGTNYQTSSGNMDHLKYTDIMLGEFTVVDGKASATLMKLTSVLKLELSASDEFAYGNNQIFQIKLSNTNAIFSYNYPRIRFYEAPAIYDASLSTDYTQTFNTRFAPVDGKYVIYVPISPFTMANGSTLGIQIKFMNSVTYSANILLKQDYVVNAGYCYTIKKQLAYDPI